MRIRFRDSDFGQVARTNTLRAKSKQVSCAEIVVVVVVFGRVGLTDFFVS